MKALSLREKAISYRKRGYSYGMIAKELGLAKSTLSNWLQRIPYTPNREVLRRIGEARMRMAENKRRKMLDDIQMMKRLAKQDIGELSNRDLFLLGIGLYLGDGEKSRESIRLVNSNPQIIKIAMKWFREVCRLKNENFRPCIHLYPDTDIEKSLSYWAKIANVPKGQFGKTQIDQRNDKSQKKKRKLPHGTLHLQIKSCGKREFGVSLHRKIMGWIRVIEEQIH